MTFMDFLTKLDDIAWGVPMLCLIMGGGLLLTIRLKGMQFKKIGLALKYMVQNEEDGEGEVTSFGALCNHLSTLSWYRKSDKRKMRRLSWYRIYCKQEKNSGFHSCRN